MRPIPQKAIIISERNPSCPLFFISLRKGKYGHQEAGREKIRMTHQTYIGDLHIHSRFSRATSRDGDPEHLEFMARKKGIHILGTGDFTHPTWRA